MHKRFLYTPVGRLNGSEMNAGNRNAIKQNEFGVLSIRFSLGRVVAFESVSARALLI